MAYGIRDFRNAFTTLPPLVALHGGRPAKADRVLSVHSQADRLLGNGRRVVARVGLQGASAWQVLNDSPVTPFQTYPLLTDVRSVGGCPEVKLTPGHFLKMSALVLPSGWTQKYVDEPGSYIGDIPYGHIEIAITWTGPGVQLTSHKIWIPPSMKVNYAESGVSQGSSWNDLRRIEIPLMRPVFANTAANLRAWSDSITAQVDIRYVGGVRAVDVVVYETPYYYARELDVDTQFATTMVTDGAGQVVGSFPLEYPVEERTATNPTFGSELLADVTDQQHHRIGPVLASWTGWDESTCPVTQTTIPSKTTTSSTYVDMVNTSLSDWRDTNPGLSISSGGHSQQFLSSNALRELRDKDGCVPVKCWAYCWVVGAGASGSLMLQTEDYSIAEIPVASSTPAWRSVTGHLRCGIGPEDTSVLMLFGKVDGGTLHVSQMCVEYADL